MDFSYSDEQRLLRDSITKFAQGELNDDVIGRDRDQIFSRDLWRKCASLGLMGLPVPDVYGGSEFDALTCAIALEALGYGCHDGGLVFSISAHLLACVLPIMTHGDEAQKQRYLPGLVDGTLVGMHAITEPESGSDTFAMRTTARRDGDDWVLNGTKTFISNAPVGDVCVLFAVTDPAKGYHGGVTGFILDRDTRGFTTGQKFEKMGLRTSAVGELVLEDVRLPASAVLGRGWRRLGGLRDCDGLGARPARRRTSRHHAAVARHVSEIREDAKAVRAADRKVPGGCAQARRHESPDRGVARAALSIRVAAHA